MTDNNNGTHNNNDKNNMTNDHGSLDPLQWPPPPQSSVLHPEDSSPATSHLKTYTAGEDKSRLQQAAKELGLQNARKPRRQVRKERRGNHHGYGYHNLDLPRVLWHVLLDTSLEDARMRATFSSHVRLTEEERRMYHLSLPDYVMDTLIEEGAEGSDEEDYESALLMEGGHGPIGGDLVSAVLGIIKGMVGPAILYLPHGFASAGYVVALPMMVVCTATFLFSSSCLLQAWRHESNKTLIGGETTSLLGPSSALLEPANQKPSSSTRQMLSYPELAFRALGENGEGMVKTGIALMQSGVCLTYLIFVPQNLHASFASLTGWDVSPSFWLLVMIAIQIPLSWIRDIRKLTPTNLLANCLILYGLMVCIGFALKEASTADYANVTPVRDSDASPSPSPLPADTPWHEMAWHMARLRPFGNDWFLFIGTSVLLFEGTITLLVPLQEAVVSEKQREQFPAVFQRVILWIIAFYLVFGIINWSAYGHEVRTVLTTSLPSGVLATTVQLAYSVAVIFTFPLQNFPALEIATRSLSVSAAKCAGPSSCLTKRNVLSSLLVCLLAFVALATMDSLDKVVSLMGSLLGCPIAFVFPPLIQLQLMGDCISNSRRLLNYFVMALGLVAMTLASVTTIITWN